VTNEELGNPDGWEEILPPAKPELVDMVPQKFQDKGTLSVAANTPYAPNELRTRRERSSDSRWIWSGRLVRSWVSTWFRARWTSTSSCPQSPPAPSTPVRRPSPTPKSARRP